MSQTKGRNKESKVKGKENDKNKGNARYKRPIEIAKGKKWRKCNICNILQPHDSRNCPKKLKLDKQGMSYKGLIFILFHHFDNILANVSYSL